MKPARREPITLSLSPWWRPSMSAVLLLGLLFAGLPPAQASDLEGIPVRLGVLVPYLVQPGGRATGFFEMPLRAEGEELGADAWRTALFVGPELGTFVRPESHESFLVGALFGLRARAPGGSFHDLSLGATYIAELQIVSLSVDLSTGEKTEERELKHHFLPTVRYTFGWEFLTRWGWYLDLAVGQTFSGEVPEALYFSAETGVQFRFGVGEEGGR